ncbi:MAG: SDR family NAD(P)-dependent oxidoreductase [Methyloligellaceae bacterium]
MKLDAQISAVITGGASGLGAASARVLGETGVKVTLFDLDEERGTALAKELDGHFVRVDVADLDSVRSGLAAARDRFGQERILVNCAGIAHGERTVSRSGAHDAAAFARVLQVNLIGTFHCVSLSAEGMGAAEPLGEDSSKDGERGVIVNTASVAAFDGQIGQVAYAASKAGVAGMTLPIARDLSGQGIRICTIAPGLFETPMMAGLDPEIQAALGAQVPFPSRLGKASEYAALVRHIAENNMLNGETIRLDGAIRLAPR